MYEAIIAILIGLDQVIKHWALNSLKDMETVPVIKNIFNLCYKFITTLLQKSSCFLIFLFFI